MKISSRIKVFPTKCTTKTRLDKQGNEIKTTVITRKTVTKTFAKYIR